MPRKFSLPAVAVLALLLSVLVGARAGYLNLVWDAASISPAFADGHKSGSRSEGGGEREGGSSSSQRGSEGGGGSSSSGGGGSGYSGGGGGEGSGGSGSGGGQRGGDGGYMYSGSGSGAGYSSNGSSGYTYSGLGGGHSVPHGDGRPPSVGVPQPELKGLPKELRLDTGNDNKALEDLLNNHWDTHLNSGEAEHASEAKGIGENAGRDAVQVFETKSVGENSGRDAVQVFETKSVGENSGRDAVRVFETKSVGENSGRDAVHAFETKSVGEKAGRDVEHASEAKGIGANSGRDQAKGWAPGKSGKAPSPAGSSLPAMPDPRSYSHTQLLAPNLSPAGVTRARALGFQIGGPGPGHGPGLGHGPGPGPGGITVMTLPPGLDPAQGMRLLQQNLPGEHFQLNNLYRVYQPAMKQDGEGHPASLATLGGKKCAGDRCYAHEAIQWNDRFSSCTRNVKIGIIDTGFDLQHPAFRNQKITQKSFLPAGRSQASTWHGTGVLALLAGRPDSGTPGLAPEATYHAAGIFYADEGGDPVTDTVSFVKALDWMSESGVRLVNMSFSGPRDDLVQKKIEALSARGFVFTAAAGNDGPAASPAYPAAYPQVIAVTAVTKDLKNYPYANRGAHIDVAAPGVDIWTAWPEAREGYRSGTSFASPLVAGVLALYPPDVLRSPKNSLLERVNISDLGPPGRDPIYGRGLLQAPSACQGNASEVAGLGSADVEVPRLSQASAPAPVAAPFHTAPAGR